MQRSSERFLTTHTGRLFRPDAGFVGMGGGVRRPDDLRREVTDLVRAQVDIGMDIVSNGEAAGLGRATLCEVIDGFEIRSIDLSDDVPLADLQRVRWLSRDMQRFSDFYESMFARMMGNSTTIQRAADGSGAPASLRTVVSGPLKLRTLEPFAADVALFKEVLEKEAPDKEGFYCVVAPEWLEEFVWNEYYKSDDEFVVALSEAMAPIFKTVTDSGLILQIDDPAISHDWEEARRPEMNLKDYEAFATLRIEAMNAALAGVPEDRVRFHTCWGSWPGMHTNEIAFKDIVRPMLRAKAQAFSIESAKSTHRTDWKVWRDLVAWPEDKIIIPGVVDHTTNVVEPPEVVADTLAQFANVCGKENVIAGTDCGMRGHAQANWEKYKNIVRGAELASAELFG